jgi:hypothetical protein
MHFLVLFVFMNHRCSVMNRLKHTPASIKEWNSAFGIRVESVPVTNV